MKIRINGNSIRFRLSPIEVETLVIKGSVNDHCNFHSGLLSYGIRASDGETMAIDFQNGNIQLSIPQSELSNWHQDDRVGFQHRSNGLLLLIEKDFKCLKPRLHEEESHLYPNPDNSK